MIKKCSGCGIVLQDTDSNKEGYVDDLNKDLCERCFRLRNYGVYKYTCRDNSSYEKILDKINKDDLVVYVVNILNLNLELLSKFKKVLLVITKRDLLPKSVKDYKIIKYIENMNINSIVDIEIVSSIKNYNLDSLYNKINKYNKTGYVYLVGNTNSGKSTLLNKIIKNYTSMSPNITESMYPSTTLDKIDIVINDKLTIVDTPGIISSGSVINYMDKKMLKKIIPKTEIRPITFQLSGSGSLIIEDIIRIDYKTVNTSMTVYMANNLRIRKLSDSKDDFLDGIEYSFKLGNDMDIVIEDLLFMKFVSPIDIKIYSRDKYNVWSRNNLI